MKKSFVIILAATLSGMVGCAEPDGGIPAVRIAPSISTRVTGVNFDAGDRIGLTIVRSSGTFIENRLLTYDGTAFTAPGLLWYNDLHEKSTLTAYYPYADDGVPAEFTVAADQTGGYEDSDLLAAVKKDVSPGTAPVAMLFHHLFSRLNILVTNSSDAAVSEVRIGGFSPTAEVDFTGPSVRVKDGTAAVEVTAFEETADACYRAVLVPQQANLEVTVVTSDGKSRSKTVPSALLEGRKQYDLAVTVTNIDIAVTLSGEIADWENGGEIGGNDGGAGTVEYGGETYRTTTVGERVWMAENLRYMPADATLGSGVWNPAGGDGAVATQGLLYDYTTATGGSVVRATSVQGICPDGWHLPDSDELAALATAETDFFCCAGYWKYSAGGGSYGAVEKGYLLGATSSESGRCACLAYGAGAVPEVVSLNANYGVSVRCVQDAAK